jgi:hypothetical protein
LANRFVIDLRRGLTGGALVDRYIFGLVAVAFILLGICMEFWPDKVVFKNRDEGDTRPPTASEIRRMRVLGLFLIAGGGYGLYCLVMGVPGAEFFPV